MGAGRARRAIHSSTKVLSPSRTKTSTAAPAPRDARLFKKYALKPELAQLINAIVFGGSRPAIETNRTDIAGIFIPDLIKVDLSTPRARLAGSGAGQAYNPDDAGFSRLSIFGGDVLKSNIQDPLALAA